VALALVVLAAVAAQVVLADLQKVVWTLASEPVVKLESGSALA